MANMDWVMGNISTNAFNMLSSDVNPHKIFLIDEEGYHLVGRTGLVVPGVVWKTKPELFSYLFFVHHSNNTSRIFTILGEEVRGCEGIQVLAILHFWIVYTQAGKICISKLAQVGTGFELGPIYMIEDYGCLGHDELILKHQGIWKQFLYTNNLNFIRVVPWLPNVIPEQIDPMMEKGFSYSFIKDNCTNLGIPCNITKSSEVAAYTRANAKEKTIFKQMSQLAGTYSASDLISALGLSPMIMYVLEYYQKLKDITEL